MKLRPPTLHPMAKLVALALLHIGTSPMAWSQTTPAVDLGTVGASTAAGAFRTDEAIKGTATAVAPTQASLQATQPQSIITREFMDLSVAPTAEYSRIVNISPSLSGDSANGPGLSETKITMRGLADGYYNITFDGIPWGDTNNPTHHSTSFFPASVIGGAVVERGPGKASDMGYATFGGSINLYSKKPSEVENTSVSATLGTWNTKLYTIAYESGRLPNYGDATVQLNYQKLESDGYLSYSPVKGENLTLKVERPVGDASLLTAFSSINRNNYFQSDVSKGVTLDQVAAFGKNFQLNNDPRSMNYWGYAGAFKNTDFSYLRLRSDWGDGWSTDNSLYTYAYENKTLSTNDGAWTGTSLPLTQYQDPRWAYSPTAFKGTPKITGDIPGYDKLNQYRVVGDIFKAVKSLETGVMRTGIWIEETSTNRHTYDLDLTTMQPNRLDGSAANSALLPGTNTPLDSVKYDQHSTIHSLQPFAEYEWKLGDGYTLTPGVKMLHITRSVDANVQATTLKPDHSSQTYKDNLPYLTLNKQLGGGMAAYGQYAKGFLIPDLNTFYVNNPTQNSLDPQKTTNYQLGLVNQSNQWTWDVDVYRIEFTNKSALVSVNGVADHYENIGGVTYQGVEGQTTYVLGGGWAAYANGSINNARANDTGKQVNAAPATTSAMGLLYNRDSWAGSLLWKRVGQTRQQLYDSTKPANYDYYNVAAYNNVDLGMAYTIKNPGVLGKSLKLQLNVFNLLNSQKVTAIAPGTAPTPVTGTAAAPATSRDGYTFQAPRSLQITAKVDF